MNKHQETLASIAVFAMASVAPATITSYIEYAGAGAYHGDNYQQYYNYTSSPPINFADPFTTTSVYGDTMSTEVSAVSSITAVSSNYLHAQGQFSGYASVTYGHSGASAPVAETYMYDEVFFSVDTPTLVTVSAFGTSSSSGGLTWTSNVLLVDNTVQDAAADGTYSILVDVGYHLVYYEGIAEAYYQTDAPDQSFSSLSASYDLQISDPGSVPEPTSLAAVGLGVLSLIRRKRNQS
ncbi:MAG: PEP-CTERM sorting domain-containing protein [Armatimonadetes bacterium]|nr:PEP-CTERM sorting domain-containing protein [Armatimonadota bacterium]